ncbi:hypothetical protein BZA77DRAFT_347441 [Pyronema omphalodes]|nr:hypothetical protein BZA77DRAFT_347441 [Pyronema omphalodes]
MPLACLLPGVGVGVGVGVLDTYEPGYLDSRALGVKKRRQTEMEAMIHDDDIAYVRVFFSTVFLPGVICGARLTSPQSEQGGIPKPAPAHGRMTPAPTLMTADGVGDFWIDGFHGNRRQNYYCIIIIIIIAGRLG